jgi:hypothetical protein
MPIRPEMRGFYLSDWPEISQRVRFERAPGMCQECGRPHCVTVRCLPDGRWFDATRRTWRPARPMARSSADGPVTRFVRESSGPVNELAFTLEERWESGEVSVEFLCSCCQAAAARAAKARLEKINSGGDGHGHATRARPHQD